MNPEKEPERHVPYSPLPAAPEPPRKSSGVLGPLAAAAALAAALGAGFFLSRSPAASPAVSPPPVSIPALPAPVEERGLEGLSAPRTLPPAPIEASPPAAKPAAGACRAYITVTNNSFQPYKYVERCPVGQHVERTDWPKAGDCGCFSGKAPPGAAGHLGQ